MGYIDVTGLFQTTLAIRREVKGIPKEQWFHDLFNFQPPSVELDEDPTSLDFLLAANNAEGEKYL